MELEVSAKSECQTLCKQKSHAVNTTLSLPPPSVMEALFSEELGLVLEVCEGDVGSVCQQYTHAGLTCYTIGTTCGFGPDSMVSCFVFRISLHLPVCSGFLGFAVQF